MSHDELTQQGLGDAADYFHEGDMMFGTAEMMVPSVVKPQTDQTAPRLSPTTFGELVQALDIVPGQLQLQQRDLSTRKWWNEAGVRETTVKQRHNVSPACRRTRCVTDFAILAGRTPQLSPLHMETLAHDEIEIGFGRINRDSSSVIGAIDSQFVHFDFVSLWNVIHVRSLVCVGFFLSAMTELQDMIIDLCVCDGRTGYGKVLDSKSPW